MKTLAILTTKSITHNRFLDCVTKELKKNYKLILVCRDISNLKMNNNIKHYQIDFPINIFELINLKKTIKFIRQFLFLLKKVDLIYVHTPIAAHTLRIIKIFLRINIKVIYHIHGLRYIPGKYTLKSIIFRFLELILSLVTDIFIVINNSDYKSIIKFVNPKNVFLVKGVGINIPKNNQTIIKNNTIFVIGVIGSFKSEKGYYQLLEIAKSLLPIKNIFFYVYGNGDKKWIKKKISNNKLSNIVLKGFVEDIEREIENFNIFLHPSHREGLNVSIQECLVRGIPVVTTNVRGCRDLIVEGYNGYIYEVQDVKKAAQHIVQLYNMDLFNFNKLKRNCIKYSKTNLDRKNLSKQIADIIKNND